MIDSIILDVDGTLWDSTPIVAKAWQGAARECGFCDVIITPDTLKGLFGKTMEKIAEAILPNESKEAQASFMKACTEAEQEALDNDPCRIEYPGVIETIKELSKEVPVTIVSNCQSGYIELFIEKSGLGAYITDKECYGDTGFGKAHNEKLVIDRNHFKFPVYVGDTEGDREASEEAGVRFIYASYGFGSPKSFYKRIDKFNDIITIVVTVHR